LKDLADRTSLFKAILTNSWVSYRPYHKGFVGGYHEPSGKRFLGLFNHRKAHSSVHRYFPWRQL